MGQNNGDAFGYGLLLLEEDNEDGVIFDVNKPKEFIEEFVGDMVLGEDQGVFLRVKSADITVRMKSEKQHGEYVVEYTDFEVSDINSEAEEWLKKFQEKTSLTYKIGVFKVSHYG